MNEQRSTSLTTEINGLTHIRGFAVTELLAKASFSQTIFVLLLGHKPNEVESSVFNAVLVAAIDHGPLAPSADIARRVASTGNSLQTAVAAGVSSLGQWHGGAISDLAEILFEIQKGANDSLSVKAEHLVSRGLEKHGRLPGYGHRVYDTDPRVAPLFAYSRQQGLATEYIELVEAAEQSLEKKKGRKICLNIDGAMAAILCQLGFSPQLQRGVFIIARTPGLVAHAEEQARREPPVLRSTDEVSYDGPPVQPWL